MRRLWTVLTCDTAGCATELRVPHRDGYWQHDPEARAINWGWTVDRGGVACPEHDPMWVTSTS